MKQIYLYPFLVLAMLLFATPATAQVSEKADPPVTEEIDPKEMTIEGLSIYPNPASGERVYITSKKEEPKIVEIFNVLGKPVLSTKIGGNELSISSLESGVYIMKIREGKNSATRKLVIQ